MKTFLRLRRLNSSTESYTWLLPSALEQHGKPDGIIQTWFGTHAAKHGLEHYVNSTVKFGRYDVFQPVAILTRHPEKGGAAGFDEKG